MRKTGGWGIVGKDCITGQVDRLFANSLSEIRLEVGLTIRIKSLRSSQVFLIDAYLLMFMKIESNLFLLSIH